jgi:hypothetical protein
MSSWRRIPPVVLVVAVASVLLRALEFVYVEADTEYYRAWIKLDLATSAQSFATVLLLAHAAGEVAARSTGQVRLGMRISMFGSLAVAASWIVVLALSVKDIPSTESGFMIEVYVYWVLQLAVVGGLVIAAGPSRGAVLACLALWLVVALPPHLAQKLDRWLDLGLAGSKLKVTLEVALRLGVIAVLFGLTPRREEAPAPAAAIAGFRRAANGLWLRVLAAAVALCVGFMAVASESIGLVKFSLFAGVVINLIGFAMFTYGALEAARSALSDMPRVALAIGGTATAWCAAVFVMRGPALYVLIAGDESGRTHDGTLYALETALGFAAAIGGAIVASAIAGFANRRGNLPLASRATSTTIAFVVLNLLSVAIGTWVIEKETSSGSLLTMTVTMLGCLLAAQVVLAKLCHAASEAIDTEASMPVARLVQ